MTHILPGGGVPRVHGARSPVLPRLPLFATPRSVHHLATVAAGAYPLRRPPDAWWPRVPAPPGPCYWLVASWTPLGWRGGCLAAMLVHGSVRHYCFGECSALFVCARRSQQVWVAGDSVFSPFGPTHPAFLELRAASRPVCVSLTLARWYAISCGLCFPGAWSGCASGIPRVSFVCVCAFALAVPRPSSFPGSAWRAHLAWFRCRAPVRPFHAVCAPPRFLPRPRALSGLLGGGGGTGSCFPHAWPGVVCPLTCGSVRPRRSGAEGGVAGGTACVRSSSGAWPEAPEGRGGAPPRSVPLPSLNGHQSGCYRRRSVPGGRGLHTAPVRVCVLIPGVVRVAPLCDGAGPPACPGLCGSRRVAAWGCVAYWLSGVPPPGAAALPGGGGLPLALGGGRGLAPPWPVSGLPRAGGRGGRGEGVQVQVQDGRTLLAYLGGSLTPCRLRAAAGGHERGFTQSHP